ncbi:MAG TPA: DoxX family protein [Terriglobales bacterium]
MSVSLFRWARSTSAPRATLLIRLLVGAVFFSEGVQKFLFPAELGVGRFAKIGIPAPHYVAPFVGLVEIICGVLLVIGLLTRLAAIPLVINISVAIAATKIPLLSKSGFWAAAHEARTDYAMLLGLSFLVIVGAGAISLDAHLESHP